MKIVSKKIAFALLIGLSVISLVMGNTFAVVENGNLYDILIAGVSVATILFLAIQAHFSFKVISLAVLIFLVGQIRFLQMIAAFFAWSINGFGP